MDSKSPLISVIIPSYNYGCYLSDAIRSVLAQDAESFETEIIVVDDGSSDNTAEIARGFGSHIRYIQQDNQGLSEARNTGIKNASGDFIIFLDADDLLGENVISTHLKNFRANPTADLSICHCYCVNTDTGVKTLWPIKAAHLDMHLCYSNIAPVHAFMIRAQTIRDTGYFDPKRKACEDYDFWLRCAEKGKHFALAPDAFVIYRQHGDSMSGRHVAQFLQDVSVRLDIEKIFNVNTHFPHAGSYYGWLAYAAGLLASSIGLNQSHPELGLEMINSSAQSLLTGAKSFPKSSPTDTHLIQAERYYALEFFINALQLGPNFTPELTKATSFIAARYSNLTRSTIERLKITKNNIYRRLLSNYSSITPKLKEFRLSGGPIEWNNPR